MKALLCNSHDQGVDGLSIAEVADPTPGSSEVVISVHAAGVNFADTLMVEGRYQALSTFPFVPGSEVAGFIKSLGKDVVGLKTGDQVVAMTRTGGFAEEVVVNARYVFKLPSGHPTADMVQAAALLATYGTAYYALKTRALLQVNETLLVLGAAGGVGLAAITLGKYLGARVVAAASTNEKLETCRQHGADELINYHSDDLKARLKSIAGARGVDVTFDPVGGSATEIAVRATAWNGRVLIIGFASGETPKLPLNLPLLKGCSVMGVFYGALAEHEPEKFRLLTEELVGLFASKVITPQVTGTYTLEQAKAAMKAVYGRQSTGKLVLTVRKEDASGGSYQ